MTSQQTPAIGLVGCGHRGVLGFLASLKSIGKGAQVVALCDVNPARLDYAWEYLGNSACVRHHTLETFLQQGTLDTVIVANRDSQHADSVVAAFAAGKHVVCEKPMATSLDDCRRMIQARGDRRFRVAFNLRYNAITKVVKQMLREGAIGRVLQVQARDDVGRMHGADYMRRWHARKANSGGLLAHKSTHTFDVINWWLEDHPAHVTASAARTYFVPEKQRGDQCRDCTAATDCPFHIDLRGDIPGQATGIPDFYRRMYLDAERHDGYKRDACVFHRENDVEDAHAVAVRYQNGAQLAYTACFFATRENRTFVLQGTDGRMEVSNADRTIRLQRSGQPSLTEVHTIPLESGGHGGADIHLARSLFSADDRDAQEATAEDGYWSLAIAACAEIALLTGSAVAVPPLHHGFTPVG